MFGLKAGTLLAAALIGVALTGWAATVAPAPSLEPLGEAVTRAQSLEFPAGAARAPAAAVAQAVATPLFTTAPRAEAVTARVTLKGVSAQPGRRAALLAFDGGDPVWVTEGAVERGVRLRRVTSAGVELEIDGAPALLRLGRTSEALQPPVADGGVP